MVENSFPLSGSVCSALRADDSSSVIDKDHLNIADLYRGRGVMLNSCVQASPPPAEPLLSDVNVCESGCCDMNKNKTVTHVTPCHHNRATNTLNSLSHTHTTLPTPSTPAEDPCSVALRLLDVETCWIPESVHYKPEEITSPINPLLPSDAKLDIITALTEESEPLLARVVEAIVAVLNIPSNLSLKSRENILEKSRRAEILAVKPWFDIEYIRDALRFKARLNGIRSVSRLVRLFTHFNISIVDVDVDKFIDSKDMGWRPISIDLRFPNGLLVEFYAVPLDMDIKAVKHLNHVLYEKWRTRTEEEKNADFYNYENESFLSIKTYTYALWTWIERQFMQNETVTVPLSPSVTTVTAVTVDKIPPSRVISTWSDFVSYYYAIMNNLNTCSEKCQGFDYEAHMNKVARIQRKQLRLQANDEGGVFERVRRSYVLNVLGLANYVHMYIQSLMDLFNNTL